MSNYRNKSSNNNYFNLNNEDSLYEGMMFANNANIISPRF